MEEKIIDKTVEPVEPPAKPTEVEASVSDILDEHGYADVEEMVSAIASSKKVQDEVGGADIKDLLEAQNELTRIKEYWAEQEIYKERDDEIVEDRAVRLEQELRKTRHEHKQEMNRLSQSTEETRQKQEARTGVDRYNKDITSYIDSSENFTGGEKEFLQTILPTDGAANINVLDKKEVTDLKKNMSKAMETLKQSIIEDYRAGKVATPKISTTTQPVTSLDEKKALDFKTGKAQAIELLQKKFGFK